MTSWIVCQLGAREHYAIPRALHQTGQLHSLVTDAWVTPQSWPNHLPGLKSLCDRYHTDLADAQIANYTTGLLKFEITHRLQKTASWDRMLARNQWFQKQTIKTLKSFQERIEANHRPVLFTYSYAGLELLRFAKQAGWRTVLGQIDPGIVEEQIVITECKKHSDIAPDWEAVPSVYWQNWQEECKLADHIVVNSNWSKSLLEQVNVPTNKIEIVPLVYQPPIEATKFVRTYPAEFSAERPLRVLFLGLITLRKGIAACLEAIHQLKGHPVEFWMVGSQQIEIPAELKDHPQVHWTGPVPRSQTAQYYQQADVFLFPTLSDGFGLTQLEAQAWKLPIIASQHCGEVVEDRQNGLILSKISSQAIADTITYCYQNPEKLADFSSRAVSLDNFRLENLSKHFNRLVSSVTSF
ncbi:glycosyltransferase family 4 protein [Leptothoe sp. LEGE 181152]|nr:glycosyltransferase family 4 protein [Leptothoe sp. LEGE 181152]